MNTVLIKNEMRNQGLTQFYIARKMHLSQSALCQKINNKRGITIKQATKLAKILNLTQEKMMQIFFCSDVA